MLSASAIELVEVDRAAAWGCTIGLHVREIAEEIGSTDPLMAIKCPLPTMNKNQKSQFSKTNQIKSNFKSQAYPLPSISLTYLSRGNWVKFGVGC